ncbi:TetR family transcriptional regulator [Mycobacterium sp. CBMA 234]|uniref:TetR/AcrR family transcriptional regulator n=1 Tax=Mycolicibacterium sp. CBMA 234 TaxID=1918495 RepID=UPI0012DEC7C9|nr:TetR/AcrR family transcriptional regulator [Mycolicibacterium sp. CBMA 234]MUL65604.1 TetR family transcriptional regulator [Mycolicibacterium sp. CBMA 234]
MRNAVADSSSGDGESPAEARQRFIDALATLIGERGYAATSVVDIVRVAQASKTTFYVHFSNKQECYLALLASVTDDLVADIRQAVDSDAHWHNQIRQMFAAYIAHLTARPEISLSWIRDLPALGAAARPIQRRNFAELANLLGELSANPGFRRAELPPVTKPKAVMLLAGVRELAAQTAEDELDIETVIGPATDIAISILTAKQG